MAVCDRLFSRIVMAPNECQIEMYFPVNKTRKNDMENEHIR